MSCMDETAARRLQAAQEIIDADQTQSEAQLRRHLGLPPREPGAAIPIPDEPKFGRILTHDDVRAIVREEVERLAGRQRFTVGFGDVESNPAAPINRPEGPRDAAVGVSRPGSECPEPSTHSSDLGAQIGVSREAGSSERSTPPPADPHERRRERREPDPFAPSQQAAIECTCPESLRRTSDCGAQHSPCSVGVGTPSVGDGQAAEGQHRLSAVEPPDKAYVMRVSDKLLVLCLDGGLTKGVTWALTNEDARDLMADLAAKLNTP